MWPATGGTASSGANGTVTQTGGGKEGGNCRKEYDKQQGGKK
jgi:hypothetical protein